MTRIAVSPRAYRAIKSSLPEGERYLLMLTEAEASRLSAIRRPWESVTAPPCLST
jgi:hypothetical protein